MTEERQQRLLALIGQAGYIKVDKLAGQVYTSASTVRRNLAALEAAGLVRRRYGGVELVGAPADSPLNLRYQEHHEAKARIAQKAAAFLKEGGRVFVDGSSTCLHLAPYLTQTPGLTVYTNGLQLCARLGESGMAVRCTGGELVPRSLAFAGEYALEMVSGVRFDAFFFSCGGYVDGVVTDYAEKECHLRRRLLKQAQASYFLCDSSKFDRQYDYVVCETAVLTAVVSEA